MIPSFCWLAFLVSPIAVWAIMGPRMLRRGEWVAMVLAAFSGACTIVLGWSAPGWSGSTRLAWIGIQAKDGQLQIGGSRETAECQWPGNEVGPALSAKLKDNDNVALRIGGGGAFLLRHGTQSPLNGRKLDVKAITPVSPSGYHLQLLPAKLPFFAPLRIRILDVNKTPIVEVALPKADSVHARVASLSRLLDARPDWIAPRIEQRVPAKTWAFQVRVLIHPDGRVWALSPDMTTEIAEPLPADLDVSRAPNQRMRVKIVNEHGRIRMNFIGPWRHGSPLPPAGMTTPVVFTASPRPTDWAFLLPLGGIVRDMRVTEAVECPASGPPRFPNQATKESGAAYLPNKILDKLRESDSQKRKGPLIDTAEIKMGPIANPESRVFVIGLVKDFPSRSALLLPLGLAWLAFSAGLFLSRRPSLVHEARWGVSGLALTLWVFLLLRLVLSLRYALDPGHVDKHSVEGVALAFCALATAPLLVLLAGRRTLPGDLHSDERIASRRAALFLTLIAFTFGTVVFSVTAGLWPEFDPDWKKFGLAFAAAWVLVGLSPAWLTGFRVKRRVLIEMWDECFERRGKFAGWHGFIIVASAFAVLSVLVGLLGVAARLVGMGELVEEIIGPLLLWWTPAFVLLAGAAREWAHQPQEHAAALRGSLLAAIMTAMSLGAGTVCLGDAGAAYAAIAIFVPLAALLVAAAGFRFRLGFAVLATIACCLFTVWSLKSIPLIEHLMGEAKLRVRVISDGEEELAKEMLFGDGIHAEGERHVAAHKIRNVVQHSWENKAIAHQGQWLGPGFGKAPARRSQVGQEIVQMDSVFSFFIVGDFGLFGGGALLLASWMCVLIVRRACKGCFDVGCGLALLFCASFAVETCSQAAMNLGLIPFTGRNLPLLAVNSLTDLLRWTVFFGLAARSLFLRYSDDGDLHPDASSLLGRPELDGRPPVFESPRGPATVIGLTGLALVATIIQGVRIANADRFREPFTWQPLRRLIEGLSKDGFLTLDQKNLTIDLSDAGKNLPGSDSQLLRQEILKFNALPREEKINDNGWLPVREKLAAATSVADMERALELLARETELPSDRARPSVFRLRRSPAQFDEAGNRIRYEIRQGPDGKPFRQEVLLLDDKERVVRRDEEFWQIELHPFFRPRVHFKRVDDDEVLPSVRWKLTGVAKEKPLIGEAVVMGERRLVFDETTPLPWIGALAEALKLQPTASDGAYANTKHVLTLDPALHVAAQRFCRDKGRAAHELRVKNAVRERGPDDDFEASERLPVGAGIVVLDITTGATLALGGWPHMTSAPTTRRTEQGDFLLPASWLEESAPRRIRDRFAGDRNFDRLVVGSASKPMWAAAVLKVHPFLHRQLRVRESSSGTEKEVFGVQIANIGWSLHGSSGDNGWIDFRNYLSSSDNRYHVRLGILGLARGEGGQIIRETRTSSKIESLGGPTATPTAWGHFPRLPGAISFSSQTPRQFSNFQTTELAIALSAMFPLSISPDDGQAIRRSFWTANENDNRAASPILAFDLISPETTRLVERDLRTQEVIPADPRAFVSMLLGGQTNMWSNVEFASMFSAVITGRPVVAHILERPTTFSTARDSFTDIAAKLRPGLHGVLTDPSGTANWNRRSWPNRKDNPLAVMKEAVERLGVQAYAKTGTLKPTNTSKNTTRFLLALVRWKNGRENDGVASGYVISTFVEDSDIREAAYWTSEFVTQNEVSFKRMMGN